MDMEKTRVIFDSQGRLIMPDDTIFVDVNTRIPVKQQQKWDEAYERWVELHSQKIRSN